MLMAPRLTLGAETWREPLELHIASFVRSWPVNMTADLFLEGFLRLLYGVPSRLLCGALQDIYKLCDEAT